MSTIQALRQVKEIVTAKTARVRCVARHGAFKIGEIYRGKIIGPSKFYNLVRIQIQNLPAGTTYPTLFLGRDGKPDGYGDWNRFELILDGKGGAL